ncbi:adenylyl-sulfate kinase [Saccharopolyspora taberi]|uniref:Adenylyl-sulfate kinase n=1 Tax=Saccharopolyspora taberi TaxID=60895 RepID=A0ABN3VHV7_9PSEU
MGVTGLGATVWFTGLPSSGKTTIANALARRLRAGGHRVEVLDGDDMRAFLSAGLGFTPEDRDTHVQRVGFVAELLASNGVKALVPVIAPYQASREAVRKRHEQSCSEYLEVHVSTCVEVCAQRDVKGLYARQRSGALVGLTGVDDPYEIPIEPDLRIDTQVKSLPESMELLHAMLRGRGLV